MIKIVAYLVVFSLMLFFFSWAGIEYSYADMSSYLQVLLVVSSMVFTIMGLWIAFLYPNALQRLINQNVEPTDFSESLNETKRLENLVGSIIRSAIVVIMIMAFFICKLLLSNTTWYTANVEVVKVIVVSVISFISILQVESIIYVIASNILFLNDLHSKRERREADEDF